MPTNPLKAAAAPAEMTAAEAREWVRRAKERGYHDKAAIWADYAAMLERKEAAERPVDGKTLAAGE